MREDAQLDLRVVRRHEPVSGLRDERAADLPAELGANRDGLEVRVRRRQTAGRGDRLVEMRVQAAVVAEEVGQRAEVRVEQLRQLAPLLDDLDDRVLVPDRAENARVRRVAGLALAPGRELELLEEDARELLRRAEHELLARKLVRLRLELLDAVGEPRGDLTHAVRVDLDADVLHRREHRGERQLDAVVQLLAPPLPQPRAQRPCESPRHLGRADQRRRFLLHLGLRQRLDPVLRGEILELVRGPSGLDQVRGDHRVLRRKLRQAGKRLVVVRDDLRIAEARDEIVAPGADDDAVVLREREAAVGDRESDGAGDVVGQRTLAPGDVGAGDDPLTRGHCLVELVDAVQEIPELEAAEHLAELRAVGRLQNELGRVPVDVEIAPHRRQLLRETSLIGELRDVLLARRRELVCVRDHLLHRAVLRNQLPGCLVADTGNARDVVGAVAFQTDEVRDLLGLDPVARLDALGCVHLHVAHTARGHHERDVVSDELEGIAVGRHDRRLDAGLVGARRKRRDHVVRLPALELEVAVAERLDDRAEVRKLLRKQVGHRPPPFLVDDVPLFGDRMAVHRARVPGHGDALRLVVGKQLEQHVREAQERIRRKAFRRRELLRERKIGAVREVVPVDEEELGVARRRVVEVEFDTGDSPPHPPSPVSANEYQGEKRFFLVGGLLVCRGGPGEGVR